jgi:hypothetical protein
MQLQKKLGGLNVKELAKEYKLSHRELNIRINELKSQKDMLALKSYSTEREGEIEELRARLKPLVAMQSELKIVTQEVKHYYDRSWWRSEKHTLNQR